LYGNLTVDALQRGDYHSELRNKSVAEAFYLTGIIEKYGSGLARIRRAVAEAGTISFFMEEQANGFLVTFQKVASLQDVIIDRENAGGGINGGINGVLEYIKQHPGSKGLEIADALKISQRTLQRLLKELKDDNKIVFIVPSR